MTTMNPYFNFDGKTEEAFNFYKSVFGGEFLGGIHKMGDAPGTEDLPEEEKNRVMHVSLPIGGGTILMASDNCPSMGHQLTEGNNVYISLHPDSREEADRLFNELSAEGKVEMPIADAFWGDYFGSFQDKFGIHWMVNYNAEYNRNSEK
ncbi:VOC family protein [Olivibacter sp. SDN3]|uniref:VOC family protein n=1 Tax=Olivibacter sp. SDN3 TaxID=2764720 RepID=UPI00165124CD|nr:VOC family protein [Olivibacter sp. SDN3]QNL49569.1 VOC family protein [Olivibacter sp. SDN3]